VEIVALIQSIWTIVVMVIFFGVILWAFSRKRKSEFDEAARLPLDDDDSVEKNIVKEK
jgi:cytochrome c oxidase cbb3-type subunit 4